MDPGARLQQAFVGEGGILPPLRTLLGHQSWWCKRLCVRVARDANSRAKAQLKKVCVLGGNKSDGRYPIADMQGLTVIGNCATVFIIARRARYSSPPSKSAWLGKLFMVGHR